MMLSVWIQLEIALKNNFYLIGNIIFININKNMIIYIYIYLHKIKILIIINIIIIYIYFIFELLRFFIIQNYE